MDLQFRLGGLFGGSTLEDFSKMVIDQAKWALMDILGVGLTSSKSGSPG